MVVDGGKGFLPNKCVRGGAQSQAGLYKGSIKHEQSVTTKCPVVEQERYRILKEQMVLVHTVTVLLFSFMCN